LRSFRSIPKGRGPNASTDAGSALDRRGGERDHHGGSGRVSRETSLLFNEAVERWRQELRALGEKASGADIVAIELNLSDVADEALRERVLAVPTSFRISEDDLQLVRRAAKSSVANSRELERFLQSIRAK